MFSFSCEKDTFIKYIFLFLISILFIAFLYKNLFYSSFLFHWDDAKNIVDNNAIKEISLNSIKTIFSTLRVGMYVPITQLTYMMDYQLFGLSSFGFHISSLIYHFITTIVCFFFFSKFFNEKTSFILSIIFLVHPVNVEPIAWLSARSTIIFTLFYILSLIQYINYLQKKKKKYYFFTFLFFLFSALSKSTAITLPVVLLGFDCYFEKKCKSSFIINKIPLLIVSIIFGYITTISKIQPPFEYSYWKNILLVSYRIFFYVIRFIVPLHYSAFYTINPKSFNVVLLLSSFLWGSLFVVVYLSVQKKLHVKNPILFLGVFLFLTTISINLNVVPFTVQIISDRYLYLPMIGLLLISGFFIQKVMCNKKNIILGFFLYIVYLIFTSLKFVNYWRNEETLFIHTLKINPNAIPVKNIMVAIYKNKQEYKKALKLANEIIETHPDYIQALNERGSLYLRLKEFKKAYGDFNRIISLNKANAATYVNIGNLYFSLKQYDSAINSYKKAIELDSTFYLAYDHLGRLYAYIKKPDDAKYYLTKAIKLNITYGMSYQTRGMVYIIYYKNVSKGCRDLRIAEKYGVNVRGLVRKFCR